MSPVNVQAPPLGSLAELTESFRRSLRAQNKSPRTVRVYTEALRLLTRHLDAKGMPTQVAHLRREHLEDFIEAILARWKPATALNRFKALAAFFHWALDEGEVKSSPM